MPEPFVPPSHLLDQARRRWESLCAANPAYYDGRLYHVLGVHRNGHGGCALHVMECAYRFFAVQDDSFDLGVRALGVKGVTRHEDLILMGRRSQSVAAYKGLWEFAPAGSVEPGAEPSEIIQSELRDETGLQPEREPHSTAVLFDPVLRCWEIVYQVQASSARFKPRTAEYTELQWCSPEQLPAELSPIARQIAELIGASSAPTVTD